MKLHKVFQAVGSSMPSDAKDACMLLNGQVMGNGNGGLIWIRVVSNPTKEEEGYGYIKDDALRQLMVWLLDEGATVGEDVLVEVSW